MAQIRPVIAECDLNFLGAGPFDRGVAEDIHFETVMPREYTAAGGVPNHAPVRSSERSLSDKDGISILQPAGNEQGKMPGFGYWLFVTLVAASVFWICGGHTLFVALR